MIKIPLFPHLTLLAVLLVSCGPSASSMNPAVNRTEPPAALASTPTFVESTLESATEVAATEAAVETVQPVATSRGPELHATDPTTVSLASGEIQFVEFFRFT